MNEVFVYFINLGSPLPLADKKEKKNRAILGYGIKQHGWLWKIQSLTTWSCLGVKITSSDLAAWDNLLNYGTHKAH